ncbi:uncharacterized protein [Chelonus insularis]|uniref:uncharacterized protein isoform X2 n=1 Tax=Chelonus insularis TaxID=460826 RepID=UPI00158EE7DE|nr:uncharacterized protein LOC118072582 isoform X2 [Chelonus insularis]
MHYIQQIFICATLCLAILDHGSRAENAGSVRNDSSHLISTVGNILTPLLLKQVERRLLNHTALSDGVISIEKLDSSTPINIDTITPNFELKENVKSSNSPMRKFKSTTVPTTILIPADREKIEPKSKINVDKLELDSARAQQRQLENQFPFDFRNHFNIGFPGVGRQSNEGIFRNGDSFTSNQFPFLTSLDRQKSNDNILGIQAISGSQIPGRNLIFNDSNQPLNSHILPLDLNRFQNFDRFRYDGRYSDSNQFFDPSFRTDSGSKSKFGDETGSRVGIESDIVRQADRYNNFAGQLYPQNDFPLYYRQNLRNNFPNSPINNQAIDTVINNQPITSPINNQRVPIGLPFRSYANPSFPTSNINENIDSFSQRFQNNFPDNRNSQQGFNYPPVSPQLYFPDIPGSQVSPGSKTLIDSQNSNNNNGNNSGVTQSSLISSRRSEDSLTKPTNNIEQITTKIPGVESLQDRIELEKLFFPQQDDYSDIRVSPDFFKQHILKSEILEKYAKTNVI